MKLPLTLAVPVTLLVSASIAEINPVRLNSRGFNFYASASDNGVSLGGNLHLESFRTPPPASTM